MLPHQQTICLTSAPLRQHLLHPQPRGTPSVGSIRSHRMLPRHRINPPLSSRSRSHQCFTQTSVKCNSGSLQHQLQQGQPSSHNISNSHQCSKQPLVKRNRSSLQLQLGPFPHSSSRDCSKLILRKCNSLSPSPLPRPPKQLPRRCQLRPCLSSSSRQLFKLILVRCNGSKFNQQLLPWPRPQQQLPLRYQLSPPFGSSSSSRQPPKQTLVK